MGLPLAIVAGALLGGAVSLVVFFVLMKRFELKERFEAGDRLLKSLETAHQKERAVLERSEGLINDQSAALKEVHAREQRVEDLLDRAAEAYEADRRKAAALDERAAVLEEQAAALEAREEKLSGREAELEAAIAAVADWSPEEAREAWVTRLEARSEEEGRELIRAHRDRLLAGNEDEARRALLTALARQGVSRGEGFCTETVALPGEAMKMRLIGREGRNARAFQRAAGVDLLIDDTPGVVLLSAFDPARRAVAARALEKLFAGSQIHPGRIEEAVREAGVELEASLLESGRAAAAEAGVEGLAEPLLLALGRLRTNESYGQNLLDHSLETAALAASLAGELGYDAALARRAGLLHDIGRGLESEAGDDHQEAGRRLAASHGEPPEVQAALADHHGEEASPYGALVGVADRLSARRPGARSEAAAHQMERLQKLEALALERPGVERAYAFKAGRELEVLVRAEDVSARGAAKMARDLARELEGQGGHPGPIEVIVIREERSREKAAP